MTRKVHLDTDLGGDIDDLCALAMLLRWEEGREQGTTLTPEELCRGCPEHVTEVARRLAARADVLLENFQPGTAERIGLGYEAVSTGNPRIVYCSISGFGQDGPESSRPAYAPVARRVSISNAWSSVGWSRKTITWLTREGSIVWYRPPWKPRIPKSFTPSGAGIRRSNPTTRVPFPPGRIAKIGPFRPEAFGRTLAAVLPENSIVTEDAVTSGRALFPPTWAAAPHDWIQNTGGAIGSFEAPIFVPQMNGQTMKVSSVVMSTQVQKAAGGRSENPLVRDGVQLLPNLTRAVGRTQKVYFYYEVYDPAVAEQSPDLRTSLAFYRGGVKVFETPVVTRTAIDEPNRRAVVFQFEVPAEQFRPGTYTCQINIIDSIASAVAFPRVSFVVME